MDLLTGIVRGYAWGDRRAIAAMQKRSPTGEPEAELWFGAHPVAPSLVGGDGGSLLDAVATRPAPLLGPDVANRFGRFPYLLKVLAAAEPLSIQAHPSLDAAAAGFAKEEAAGIPIDSPVRTYRDDNHKPELICALTPFEAKCGFRSPTSVVASIETVLGAERANGTLPDDRGGRLLEELGHRMTSGSDQAAAIADALGWLLKLTPEEASAVVARLVGVAEECSGPVGNGVAEEIRWTAELHRRYPFDVGVVVSLLLNHVSLAPGDAMFLGAGNLHAYLRGVGVELMANSDNVVRGGLTEKHIDVDELLAIVDTTPAPAPVQRPTSNAHTYESPVDEFALTRIGRSGQPLRRRFDPIGPEMLLVTEGEVAVQAVDGSVELRVGQGSAALIEAIDGPYDVVLRQETLAWRAAVGAT
ncbi:MAG: mannose-6-phosphate isomerase, class I [Acidimicrobiales bacterium]